MKKIIYLLLFLVSISVACALTTTYNFSSTYEGVNMWAYSWDVTSGSCSDAQQPPNAFPEPTSGTCTKTDISTNSNFDSIDGNVYQTVAGNVEPAIQYFRAKISGINISTITLLNWTWTGYVTNTQQANLYISNFSSSAWINPVNTTSTTQVNLSYSTTDLNIINSTNNSVLVVGAKKLGSTSLYTDYVSLIVNYDGIQILSPITNQSILNNLSTVLNVSSTRYNNTIWYSWNGGISNNTLCTTCASANWTQITFPRQGYYNLTVWGNDSSNNIISQNVTNIFIQNNSQIDLTSTYENISMWAFAGDNATSSGRCRGVYGYRTKPATNLTLLCYSGSASWAGALVDVTNNPSLDADDDNTLPLYTSYDNSYDINFLKFNVSYSNISNYNTLTSIIFQTELLAAGSSANPGTNYSVWNYTGKKWYSLDYVEGYGKYNKTITTVFDITNNSIFEGVIYFYNVDGGVARGYVNIDYVFINLTYYLPNIAPSISLVTSDLSRYNRNSTFNISYNVSDDNDWVKNISLYLNNTLNTTINNQNITANANNTLNFTLSNVLEGNHTYKIVVCDSDNNCTNSSTQSFQSNYLPIITNVQLSPASPSDIEDVNCTNATGTDGNGDTVTIAGYNWNKNGAWLNINQSTLKEGNYTTSDTIYCQITPFDGYQNGTSVNSLQTIIGSSNPTINWTNATTTTTGINSTVANPTNNNSWINLSLTFNQAASMKWTVYFCDVTGWNPATMSCAGTTYCNSSLNTTTYPTQTCNLSVSGLTASSFTYTAVVKENSSLAASTTGTFEINHPPSTPTIVNPIDTSIIGTNWTLVNYSSSDSDGDVVNYTIYNSTDGLTWDILNITDTISYYNWTNLLDDTYYLMAFATDSHGYSNYINSSATTFTVDTTAPILQNASNTASIYTNDVGYLYADCYETPSTISNIVFTLEDPATNIYTYSVLASYSGNTFRKAVLFNAAGNWTYHNVTCTDSAGNTANLTANITISVTTYVAPVTPSGGGGGAAPADTEAVKKAVSEEVKNQTICGNGVCQAGENPLVCPADCPLNLDDVICIFGSNKACPAWAFNFAVYGIMGFMLVVLYNRSKKEKRI